MDSKSNVIVNVQAEPANINDITSMPEILKEIEKRLDASPDYNKQKNGGKTCMAGFPGDYYILYEDIPRETHI